MKQKRFAILTVALSIALALVLAGALVACNKKDDNDEKSVGRVFSEEQFISIVGFLYSNLEQHPNAMSYVYYYSADAVKESKDELVAGVGEGHGVVSAMLRISGDEPSQVKAAELMFLSSPEEAAAVVENFADLDLSDWVEFDSKVAHAVGNVAVVESEEGLFEEQIMKAELPDRVSQARRDLLKQGYDKIAKAYGGYAYIGIEDNDHHLDDDVSFYFEPEHGNCTETLYFSRSSQTDILEDKEMWEKEKKFYENDCMFDDQKEEGYVFVYYKVKPGFTYSEIENGEDAGKLIVNYYYYTEDLSELVIPAKIGDKDVAQFESYGFGVENITVSEGIKEVYISDNIKSLTLPSTLKSLSVSSNSLVTLTIPVGTESVDLECASLTTINFAGSTADFKQKFDYAANDWCNVQVYDPTTHDFVYSTITISVVCSDGTLTYPDSARD